MLRIVRAIKILYRSCPFDKAVRPRDDDSRKWSDPATTQAPLRNADQER
ncbi:MAG: hypothetical protein F6K48_08780 [Okeania sp. SIO3H1]|nr:hypothetical protein [Okeania sp. SIO1I7]NEN89001.1 hypothetical protein [Okeania sp. SIO3H1]NET24405.1 hypothetical protein [Okeania sp. SIO1I7]